MSKAPKLDKFERLCKSACRKKLIQKTKFFVMQFSWWPLTSGKRKTSERKNR